MTAHAPVGHLVLIGLPGAGKSTVGPLVARALGRPFVDLDAAVERRAGCSVAEVFARRGEDAFRALEAAATAALVGRPPAVLAAGGGWVANRAARLALADAGRTVYLRVPPGVAAERAAGERHLRPLLAEAPDPLAAVGALLARRGPLYEAADATVDAAAAPGVVADRVVAAVRAWEPAGV